MATLGIVGTTLSLFALMRSACVLYSMCTLYQIQLIFDWTHVHVSWWLEKAPFTIYISPNRLYKSTSRCGHFVRPLFSVKMMSYLLNQFIDFGRVSRLTISHLYQLKIKKGLAIAICLWAENSGNNQSATSKSISICGGVCARVSTEHHIKIKTVHVSLVWK